IGATATKRTDGRQMMVDAIFGPPLKEIVAVAGETASSMPITAAREIRTEFEYAQPTREIDYQDLVGHIMLDEKRNELIVTEAKKDWKAGRSVLVTTNRVAHAELLGEMLRE